MTPVLEVAELAKSFTTAGRTVAAVRGVTFGVEAGEILAFLGPNGAGKTTTIKMIAGLVEPTSGRVRVAGLDPARDRRAARHTGAVLEGSRNVYWRLTPLENLEYFGALRGLTRRVARERGVELLERFGLADRRDAPVRSFSRGMQQKVAIAVSVLHQPRLLLLDEPTLGLDVRAAEEVKRLVRELADGGTSILLTTHHLAVAEEISHRVAVIRDGRLVVQGGMGEVLAGFSTPAFRVVFRGTPHPGQLAALERLRAEVSGEAVVYTGPAAGVYQVIEALHPLELVSVSRDQKSLTDVFLQLTRQEAGV